MQKCVWKADLKSSFNHYSFVPRKKQIKPLLTEVQSLNVKFVTQRILISKKTVNTVTQ